MAEMKENK